MPPRGDEGFLQAALRLGFLANEALPEIERERLELERFHGRAVAVEHVAIQHGWMTGEQVDRLRECLRRRIMLCPHCWLRLNTFGLEAGTRVECGRCKRSLRLPTDACAELLDPQEAGDATLDIPNATPAPGPPADSAQEATARHRSSFGSRGFRLLEMIGKGGMGVVYKAVQYPLQRIVAIKVMRRDLEQDPRHVRRFFREARAAARIEHPNIVPIHEAGRDATSYYLMMAYVDGVSLQHEIDRKGALPPSRSLSVALDIARGLGAAHRQGVVHRDIKPSNLLLRADGSACVTDFGLVRLTGAEVSRITRTGELVGTLRYMSREQMLDPRNATPASDVYSLGATLYHMLTGAAPFAGLGFMDIARHLHDRRTPCLPSGVPHLPPALVSVVNRMMAPEPADRYADGGAVFPALADALRALHGDGPDLDFDHPTPFPGQALT